MEALRPVGETPLDRPSLFDILAAQNADSLVKPLLSSALTRLGAWPRLGVLSRHADVLAVLLRLSADGLMLWTSRATLFEAFYGVERACVRGGHWWLVVGTLIDKAWDADWIAQKLPFSKHERLWRRLKALALALDVLLRLLYLTGDSRYYGLGQLLLQIRYRQAPQDMFQSGLSRWLLTFAQLSLYLAQSGFFARLQKTWQRQSLHFDAATTAYKAASPSPDPKGLPVPSRPGLCPICTEPFSAPVALPTGYVFCKECLDAYWRTKDGRSCPVSRHSLHDWPVINLYL